jgi:hypothetical protein
MAKAIDLLTDLGVSHAQAQAHIQDLENARLKLAECPRHTFEPFSLEGLKVCRSCKVVVASREATLYEQGLQHGARS